MEAAEVIRNNLNNRLGLETRIKTAIGANDVTEKVSDGVRETIWRGILTGKPAQMHVVKASEKDIFGQQTKELQADIDKTSKEINRLVYSLYQLTDDEIQQIESVTGME